GVPPGVAERPVVPLTPGNSGRGKGPWFKANARSDRQPGDWHAPTTSSEGWEVADGVAHQSEELAGLPVLRPIRQGVSPRRLGVGLCPLPARWWRARGRRPKFRRHREVGTRPVAGRIGGRTQKGNVPTPAGSARVHPQPKGDGKQRPLGIPCIRDRVVQTATMLVLEPIFEADLEPEQHAYRLERSAL